MYWVLRVTEQNGAEQRWKQAGLLIDSHRNQTACLLSAAEGENESGGNERVDGDILRFVFFQLLS